jgi:hypothetical protein
VALFTGVAVAASVLGLTGCTTTTSTFSASSCNWATPAQAMAAHGSIEVRTLRRNVIAIVDSVEKQLESVPADKDSGSSIPPALGDDVGLLATRLAALKYPPQYQTAADAMVTQTQSLAASLRSGRTPQAGNALFAAVNASQKFYKALDIPSVCTRASGS